MADIGHDRDEVGDADEAALAIAARHVLHDEELIAALAVDGLAVAGLDGAGDADDIARARSLVARCATCRDLHDDLAAISGALRSEARRAVSAPRDFRLSTDDARRLGGTISRRGFVRSLRRAMAGFGRPVGASMAALGVAGVLVGSLSFGWSGVLAPTDAAGIGGGATRGPLSEQPGPEAQAPDKTADGAAYGQSTSRPTSGQLTSSGGESPRDVARTNGSAATVALFATSIGLLVAGLGLALYASRRTDRRRLDPSRFR